MSRDRGLPQHSECFNAREFDLWQKFSSSDLSYLLSVEDVIVDRRFIRSTPCSFDCTPLIM